MNGEIDRLTAGEDDFAEGLLERIAQRDDDAMEQLYSLYQDAIYRLALVRFDSSPVAAQRLQELMLQLWSGTQTWLPGERPRTWLLRLAARPGEATLPADAETREALEAVPDPSTAAVASAPDARHAAENLHSMLRRLPERYRSVVHLAYFEHLSDAEIARVLDRPESAVTWHRQQGRDALASLRQLRDPDDGQDRERFLDSWIRRELRTAPDPSPGDFGLDVLRAGMRECDRQGRGGLFARLLRWFTSGMDAMRASAAG